MLIILPAFASILLIIPIFSIAVLTLLTLAACFPSRPLPEAKDRRKLAIIIPAHNEEVLIAETVAVALAQRYAQDKFEVVVIADNCNDRTVALAREAGARVLERSGDPGKGQALKYTLDILLQEDWDGFLITDADSHLGVNSLQTMNNLLADKREIFQFRYGVLNPDESIRTTVFEFSMASFNALRLKGKDRLGISVGINGNGFGFSRDVIQKVPYLAHSIVEDIEYHMHLLNAGYRVHYSDHGSVLSQMPVDAAEAETQRERWERGRIFTIKAYAPNMARLALTGNTRGLMGLLDIFMPPVSLICILLLVGTLLGGQPFYLLGMTLFVLLIAHYLISAYQYGRLSSIFKIALYIPYYFVWKTVILLKSLISKKTLGWIRTKRH
ncbi:MAG: cellulose synthase/poly-beta-1,6-N-acetylglucosamine synthase-like glycosyltransferase [Arenicella sp.]|jgi:cellulose synthase/poly-beta-1,6-N-acetylglucosamine synthase-like glycosyltransferase